MVICKFNKYVYEAKKCWTCKLQSKFYMQTTTYYVHETTNTRFTFENCGGCLKQIRKKMLGCQSRLNITSTNNEYEATNILFTFENRGGALKQN